LARVPVRLSRWLLPPLLCVILVACAEDDADRRFANEPLPTEDLAATSTASGGVQVTFTPTVSSASPVPVAQILAVPGGASTIVLRSGDDIISFSPPWTEPRTIWSSSGDQILAFAATPAGNLIAVLIAPADSSDRVDLILLDEDSTVIRTIENLGATITSPPAPESPAGVHSLSWSPDGTEVMVGLATGGILAVPLTGDPRVMVGPARAGAPGQVSWSPSGNAIAYISPAAPKLAGGLYVAPTGALPLDPVPIVPPSSGGRSTISRFAWSPNGATLYYTNASTTGDPTFGGDLFQIPAAGGTATLVATASRVGPVSAITNFALSPDGAGTAYVVTVPADDGTSIDSLWLQPIGTTETIGLPVGSGERVTSLTWTTDGLIWSTTSAGDAEEPILYRAKAGETPGIVYGGPAATPVASPVASPPASPEAASPVAE
jgi:dipeptidyl aminopeptidase/acylaminoacyl peptidase